MANANPISTNAATSLDPDLPLASYLGVHSEVKALLRKCIQKTNGDEYIALFTIWEEIFDRAQESGREQDTKKFLDTLGLRRDITYQLLHEILKEPRETPFDLFNAVTEKLHVAAIEMEIKVDTATWLDKRDEIKKYLKQRRFVGVTPDE